MKSVRSYALGIILILNTVALSAVICFALYLAPGFLQNHYMYCRNGVSGEEAAVENDNGIIDSAVVAAVKGSAIAIAKDTEEHTVDYGNEVLRAVYAEEFQNDFSYRFDVVRTEEIALAIGKEIICAAFGEEYRDREFEVSIAYTNRRSYIGPRVYGYMVYVKTESFSDKTPMIVIGYDGRVLVMYENWS